MKFPWQGQDGGRFGPAVFGPAMVPIALAATIASTAMSALGSIQQGQQAEAAANYRSQVAANNATIAQQNAVTAEAAGASKEQREIMKTRSMVGAALASQASSGLDVNSGSALNVRESSAALGTLSGLSIRDDAARRAYGFRQQAGSFTSDSEVATAEGENAMTAGIIGAGGAALSGASKVGGMAAEFQRTGAMQKSYLAPLFA